MSKKKKKSSKSNKAQKRSSPDQSPDYATQDMQFAHPNYQLTDDNDDGVEEEPVPRRLVAFFIFFLCVFVLVTGYFQSLPSDRFPEQFGSKVGIDERFDRR